MADKSRQSSTQSRKSHAGGKLITTAPAQQHSCTTTATKAQQSKDENKAHGAHRHTQMSNTPVMQQLRLPPQHGRYYQAVDNIHAKGLDLVVCTNTRPACLAVLYCHAVDQPPVTALCCTVQQPSQPSHCAVHRRCQQKREKTR